MSSPVSENTQIGSPRAAAVAAEVWIVKAGSRVLTKPGGGLDRGQVASLASQIAQLVAAGRRVVLVSSGAVASGVGLLGLPSRPTDVATLQAVAAAGQSQLIQAYEEELSKHGLHAAQILLTADDLDDRVRYLNFRNTLAAAGQLGLVPILNENDTVAVEELQMTFGDNDRLAAMVAGVFPGSLLVILSDVAGLYDRDPATPGATVLSTVPQVDESVWNLVRDRPSGVSKGGMASKLSAARFVNSAGSPAIVAPGRREDVLSSIAAGEDVGTLFLATPRVMEAKKRWIGFTAACSGTLTVDTGAAAAIAGANRSLLPVGVRGVQGNFAKGDTVSVVDSAGVEIARGQCNYTADEVRAIAGRRSDQIAAVLGHRPYETVIHRDNLVVSARK